MLPTDNLTDGTFTNTVMSVKLVEEPKPVVTSIPSKLPAVPMKTTREPVKSDRLVKLPVITKVSFFVIFSPLYSQLWSVLGIWLI